MKNERKAGCDKPANENPSFAPGTYACAFCGKRSTDPTHLCVPVPVTE